MAVVTIGPQEKQQIAAIVAKAKANPIPLDLLMKFAVKPSDSKMMKYEDRPDLSERPASECLMLGNVQACYSVEEQPHGFCGHLSLLVGNGHKVISPELAVQVMAEFGLQWPPDSYWVEEIEPDVFAINLVQCYQPKQEGTA